MTSKSILSRDVCNTNSNTGLKFYSRTQVSFFKSHLTRSAHFSNFWHCPIIFGPHSYTTETMISAICIPFKLNKLKIQESNLSKSAVFLTAPVWDSTVKTSLIPNREKVNLSVSLVSTSLAFSVVIREPAGK